MLTNFLRLDYDLAMPLFSIFYHRLIQTLFAGTPAETLPAPCKTMKIKPRKSDKGAVQVSYEFSTLFSTFSETKFITVTVYFCNSKALNMNESDILLTGRVKRVCLYTEPQKKRRNFNNSIRYGKQQSIYLFSLNYKFLLQHKVLVLITKS